MRRDVACMRRGMIAAALFGSGGVQAQQLNTVDLLTFGGAADDSALSVDAYGGSHPRDIVFGGSYLGPMSLPAPAGGTFVLPHGGQIDSFAAMYRPGNGYVDWRFVSTGALRQEGPGIHAMADGRIAFVTAVEGLSVIAPGEPEELTISSVDGSFDPVLCVLDEGGVMLAHDWIFGPLTSLVRGFASAGDGTLTACVYGRGEMTVGFGTANAQTVTPTDDKFDTFVVRYDASLVPLWLRANGGADDDFYYAAATSIGSETVIAGQFKDTSIFSRGQFDSVTLSSAGDFDGHVGRYGSGGELRWARRFGGTGAENILSVTELPDGDAILCGLFSGSTVLPSAAGGSFILHSAGGTDALVARVRISDGLFVWARSYGSGGDDAAQDCAVVPGTANRVVVAGSFRGVLREGTTTLLTSRGGSDVFAIALDTVNGARATPALQAGGTGNDVPAGATGLLNRRAAIVGSFSTGASFGSLPPVATNGGTDGFVWTLALDGPAGMTTWESYE